MEPLAAALIGIVIGILLGAATGTIPGIHVNNLAIILVGAYSSIMALFSFMGNAFSIFIASIIISSATVHTFVNIIPSVFIGAPEGETALSVLPGHRMLLNGDGYEAIKLSAIGSAGAVYISLLILPLFRLFVGDPVQAYWKMSNFIPLMLLSMVCLLIITECGTAHPMRIIKNRIIICDDFWKHDDDYRRIPPTEIGPIKRLRMGEYIKASHLQEKTGRRVRVHGRIDEFHIRKNRCILKASDDVSFFIILDAEKCDTFQIGEKYVFRGRVGTLIGHNIYIKEKVASLFIFLLSGFLGILLLCIPGIMTYNIYPFGSAPVPSSAVLLPLFMGLFGLPTIILSYISKPSFPEQKVDDSYPSISKRRILRGIFAGTAAGATVGIYPGVSSAQATILAKYLSGEGNDRMDKEKMDDIKEFIVSLSSVNTANMIFNLMALFVIMRARSGVMHSLSFLGVEEEWHPIWNIPENFTILLLVVVISGIFGYHITLFIGKNMATVYSKIPYRKLAIFVILFIILTVFIFSGIMGLAILLISTLIGMLPPLIGIRRVHLMGCILLPVILSFSGLLHPFLEFIGFGG